MDRITRPLPPPEDYLMQEIPKMETGALQRMPLFRPNEGPTPSISVTPPVLMRTTPPTVR